jgi:hypothetical protein
MMQLREVRLTGSGKENAVIKFMGGGNVIAGDSDTGKSYIVRCIDYVLGAEEMTKKIDEDAGYETVFLEFENSEGKVLTLSRHLTGGDVRVHYSKIDAISDEGTVVAWKRQGKSLVADVTSIFLPFAGMKEAQLRSNAKGETQRLSVRTLLPVFLVDENSIIAERSPVYGSSGFDQTPRKRMLSYLITGIDDEGIISIERSEIAQAEARAKLALVGDLLKPIEERLHRGQPFKEREYEAVIQRADETINRLSSSLAEDRQERARLQQERNDALVAKQHAEGQIVAIDELLKRYELLNKRYDSDLQRLDFIAEGSHFLGGLQESRCPLCDQPMDEEHRHIVDGHPTVQTVYQSAKAEAAKILGLRNELVEASASLSERKSARVSERNVATKTLEQIDTRIDRALVPALHATKVQLDTLFQRRLELESVKSDSEQVESLNALKASLEQGLAKPASAPKDWAQLDSIAVHEWCLEIEKVLKEWSWKGAGRVEFDEKRVDIKVDGKPRQSHGKGVRAVLHAAFILALMRFCHVKKLPHPGFVVLDSPLTTFKQGKDSGAEEKIDPSIEAAFWESLQKVSPDLQVVVFDNKEPPEHVAAQMAFTSFKGIYAKPGERRGFIPQ